MKKLTAVERDDSFEEIDTLIERDLNSAFGSALSHDGHQGGDAGRYWSELAALFRRGAELADALAFSTSAPKPTCTCPFGPEDDHFPDCPMAGGGA